MGEKIEHCAERPRISAPRGEPRWSNSSDEVLARFSGAYLEQSRHDHMKFRQRKFHV
jgi:hypothetical protein